MNLHIYRDLYSTLYEILFIYVHEKYPNISTIYNKVQEIYTNSNIDETNLTYYICTTNSEQSWQAYDYVFLTCGTFAYHDPYNLKGKKDISLRLIQHIIR